MQTYLEAQGWLERAERELLVRLAREVPPDGFILNVGVEYGASVVCLWTGNPWARLLAVDVDNSKIANRVFTAQYMTQDSKELLARWSAEQGIDLAFIDGDHGYAGVLSDCGFARFIKPSGVIVFHDYVREIVPGVRQAIDEWWRAQPPGAWQDKGVIESTRYFQRAAR